MLDTPWWWTARSTTSTCCPAVSSTPRPCPSLVSAHLPARLHRSPGTHGCEWKRPGRHRTWGSIHRLDAAGRRAGPRRSRFQPHRDPLQRPLIWGPRLGAALGAQDPLLPSESWKQGVAQGTSWAKSSITDRIPLLGETSGASGLAAGGTYSHELLPGVLTSLPLPRMCVCCEWGGGGRRGGTDTHQTR